MYVGSGVLVVGLLILRIVQQRAMPAKSARSRAAGSRGSVSDAETPVRVGVRD